MDFGAELSDVLSLGCPLPELLSLLLLALLGISNILEKRLKKECHSQLSSFLKRSLLLLGDCCWEDEAENEVKFMYLAAVQL